MFAQIALPLPLPGALTYGVPEAFRQLAVPGARARVQVGKRRLVGVIVGLTEEPPAGFEMKPLLEVIDAEPPFPEDLLRLAQFTADYYLAPLGEVLRAMLPSDLSPWGDQRVWLTDRGAMALPKDEAEAAIVAALHTLGRTTVAKLQVELPGQRIAPPLEALRLAGRVAIGEARSRGTRYRAAYELAPGDLSAQLEACGRSPAARDALQLLAALGRPAGVDELQTSAGASPAVLRRLVGKGLLRVFSQPERLDLDRHQMKGRERAPFELRGDQSAALAALTAALERGDYAAFLLAGVTGAGKTEVYLRAAAAALARGRSTILLVPEIALVPALAREARERFGDDLALLHSGLGAAERQQEWERVRGGGARVVLGPRSALFAPVERLGLIVVDEEQDSAYKQESSPRYNGRDLALVRAQAAGAIAVLVSATPSLETRHNVELGKITTLGLTARAGQGALPEGILVDLREVQPGTSGAVHFSGRLIAELDAALTAGDQAILLRNRRGYAPMLLCRACGEDMRCPDCGLPRTFHRRERRLICHYCGASLPAPERCPACGEAALEPIGAGTERVEEQFSELFPNVPVEVLDRDTVRKQGSVAAVLERFARGDVRVLIGTQMVSKGHHFPGVALTGVLAADSYLGFPDFRAVERTYALLTQLAGRAGRGERPGRMVIQTFHPEHYAIRAALEYDDAAFAAEEMRFRKLFHYPPFTRMVQLLAQHRDRAKAESRLADIAARFIAHPDAAGVRVVGPAPAPFEKLRGEWRFQLLVRARSGARLRAVLREVLGDKPPSDVTVDVDPYQLL